MHPVTQYALDVVNTDYGRMCGKWEILACQRHLDDLKRSEHDDFPYVFDATRADRIYRHFAGIPRTDIAGKFIEFENWQLFDYGCIFGWVRKDDGRRRFKRAYQRIARGHAKTTVAAGMGLYFMCGDALYPPGHPELAQYDMQPSVNIVAVDRQQGNVARNDMAVMARAAPQILKRLDIKSTYIRNKTRGGDVIVFSKDKGNKDGGRPSLVITEEWHAHLTNDIHGVAVSAMGKKPQCLELIITTAGEDAENKPCYKDDLQYKRVLAGEIQQDDTFIMIREIDDDDDPHDKSCWCKANAFFRGNSDYAKVLYEEVEGEYIDAYNDNNYDKIRTWLIKRMNRWQVDAENKYFSGCMDKFKALCIPHDEFIKLTRDLPGHYGFDLGKTMDLSGVAYVTQLPDMRLAVSVHGFMPQNSADKHAKSDRVPYLDWAKDGYVTLTPGDVTDNRYVEAWIYNCEEEYGWTAQEIDYDGHNAVDMAIRMREYYNSEEKVVEIPQTCAGLNQATKRFRELVLSGQVVAEYSPLFIWCLNNAIEVKNNFGDIKLSKKHKDDTQRIDPVAAMMNALARLIVKIDNNIDINRIIEERGYVI
jgi:phage terminase large subunit-like protein